QRALARRAASRSIVLLRNEGDLLPLDVSGAVQRIAVVGPLADSVRGLQGDYHYPAHSELTFERDATVNPPLELPASGGASPPGPHYTEHVTVLAGLRRLAGDTVSIDHEPGCAITGDDRAGLEAAVALARAADVAIVCVGGESGLMPHSTVGETRDASDLS